MLIKKDFVQFNNFIIPPSKDNFLPYTKMHFVGFSNLIQAICLQSLRLSIKSTKKPRILQIRVFKERIVCQDIRITNIIHLLKKVTLQDY